jgi:hypothetical protein
MYDWHRHNLSDEEKQLMSHFDKFGRYPKIWTEEDILEFQVALQKVRINEIIDKIKDLLTDLPEMPHKVNVCSRLLEEKFPKNSMMNMKIPELPTIYDENYPEYIKYFDTVQLLKVEQTKLKFWNNKLRKHRNPPVRKEKGKKR